MLSNKAWHETRREDEMRLEEALKDTRIPLKIMKLMGCSRWTER